MFRQSKIILLLLFGFQLNNFYAQVDTETPVRKNTIGMSGSSDIILAHPENPNSISALSYYLELLPGQTFTGWYYYWSFDSTISADLQESPSVSWLSFNPTSFTSTDCGDVIRVQYNFNAPTTPGSYSTNIVDLNGNWSDTEVKLLVTDAPYAADSLVVQVNAGETDTVELYTQTWNGFGNLGCETNYVPATTISVNLSETPSASWLELEPSDYTISLNNSTTVDAIISADSSGSFSTYVFVEAEWFTYPIFYHVELKTSDAVAWSNGNGGNFNEGSNWVGGKTPDETQVALFDSSYYTSSSDISRPTKIDNNPFTITFDQFTTTKGLEVGPSQVIFDLQEHSYGIDHLQFVGPPGLPDESQLEIINGDLGTTGEAGIGTDGSVGQFIVSSGGIFEYNPSSVSIFYVGKDDCGNGECGRLIIQNGGQVYTNENENGFSAIGSNGAEGSVFISGQGSKWEDFNLVSIGSGGTGLLEISDKAAFYANTVWLAETKSSEGTINATGSQTGFIIQGELTAGLQGNAEINLSSGAIAFLGRTILGSESGSNGEITVTDTMSNLNITSDTLFIGEMGSGGISILNGSTFESRETIMPGGTGGIGSALVDGEGSKWLIETTLRLGYDGVGFVRLTNNGILDAGIVQIGPLGTIEDSGGNLVVGGNPPSSPLKDPSLSPLEGLSDNGATAYIDTLLISEGAQILADSVIFEDGGYLGGDGSFSFNIVNSGGLNPGDSINTPGTLIIDANYTQQNNGTLFIELEGDSPGSGFDQLVITGNANLAGTLDVSVLNIYEPQVGQTFEILTANNITGTFENIITHRGLDIDVKYNSNNIIIAVTSPVPVNDENNSPIPTEFLLGQNYPNPFNPTTKIKFSIPNVGTSFMKFIELKVYDVLGNEVATLVNEEKPAGVYQVTFDASGLTSGIYLYRMQAGSFNQVNKMILIK